MYTCMYINLFLDIYLYRVKHTEKLLFYNVALLLQYEIQVCNTQKSIKYISIYIYIYISIYNIYMAKAHEIGTSSTKKRLLLVISTRFS